MTSSDKIVYNTADTEVTVPLNSQAVPEKSLEAKESRCNSRKCMLLTALGVAVAITASSLGYYYGVARPEKLDAKPRYTYKRMISSNSTTSTIAPISLSSSSQ